MKLVVGMVLLFSFQLNAQVNRYDVLIHEIMPDPSPAVGLPNAEYIELKNVSTKPINLLKWKIGNGSSTATINTSWMLQPDSFVVLCSRTLVSSFDTAIRTIGITSFPALQNESGNVILFAADGRTIHAMSYESGMHENLVKQAGGWSLELRDVQQPCNRENWHSSRHVKGGTPGLANSISDSIKASVSVQALDCIAQNPGTLLLQLNVGIDSASVTKTVNFQITPSDASIVSAEVIAPFFNQIKINLQNNLLKGKTYKITVQNIRQCNSLVFDSITALTAIQQSPEKGDVILNEILFNPGQDGADFIEIVNTSNKLMNCKELLFASMNDAGVITGVFPATTKNKNFFPGDHLVFTTDSVYLTKHWREADKNKIIKTNALPSMPDEKGNIGLLTIQGDIIDGLNYHENMHFALLNKREGVSLERISWIAPSSERNNWHSASSASGYGTPTRPNSQYNNSENKTAEIHVQPQVITPDNNGSNDILGIHYQFSDNGNLLTCNLFTEHGVLLGKIINNVLCGTSGSHYWNGMVHGKMVRKGIYILLINILSTNGKSKQIKKMIAVQ